MWCHKNKPHWMYMNRKHTKYVLGPHRIKLEISKDENEEIHKL